MNTAIAGLIAALSVVAVCGVMLTKMWRRRADSEAVRRRLEAMFAEAGGEQALTVAAADVADPWFHALQERLPWLRAISKLVDVTGVKFSAGDLLICSLGIALLIAALSVVLGLPLIFAVILFLLCAAAPYVVLSAMARSRRDKFVEQLPDAIDLMISVLRSGLSVQHAIKSAAEEIPSPCGAEFLEVLHRINLGQSLPDALLSTVDRYDLFELDLLRRATSIQLELGGSLADLLDKTNSTLRQRIRLKRQVRVLTAQSRLSGVIIALLPFVVAIGFYFLNHDYLRPLYETNIGKMFMVAALCFQIAGILIIRQLSTFKV